MKLKVEKVLYFGYIVEPGLTSLKKDKHFREALLKAQEKFGEFLLAGISAEAVKRNFIELRPEKEQQKLRFSKRN